MSKSYAEILEIVQQAYNIEENILFLKPQDRVLTKHPCYRELQDVDDLFSFSEEVVKSGNVQKVLEHNLTDILLDSTFSMILYNELGFRTVHGKPVPLVQVDDIFSYKFEKDCRSTDVEIVFTGLLEDYIEPYKACVYRLYNDILAEQKGRAEFERLKKIYG